MLWKANDVLLLVAEVTKTLFEEHVQSVSEEFKNLVLMLKVLTETSLKLSVCQDFYRSERCGLSRFLLVPDSLDQWAESMQQRLLGYQEQARTFLKTSREGRHVHSNTQKYTRLYL